MPILRTRSRWGVSPAPMAPVIRRPLLPPLTNLPGASISKLFGPNPILSGAGNSSTLTITVQNTGNFQLDGMGVTDTLPSGMTVSGSPTTDCGGTVTNTANSVTLAGGILAGSSSCVVQVDVTAPTAGEYQNCIPANSLVDNQDATNIADACDTLVVISPPTISKAFSPTTIAAGATSALTFTLRNPAANTVALTGVGFTDTFPAGMTLASLPNACTMQWHSDQYGKFGHIDGRFHPHQ